MTINVAPERCAAVAQWRGYRLDDREGARPRLAPGGAKRLDQAGQERRLAGTVRTDDLTSPLVQREFAHEIGGALAILKHVSKREATRRVENGFVVGRSLAGFMSRPHRDEARLPVETAASVARSLPAR